MLDAITQQSSALFTKCFGHLPRWLAAAPGRVNLIGEHTDYNDGFVLPMAIDRYTVFAADRNDNRQVTLHSATSGDTANFSLRAQLQRGEPAWSNYVRGVVASFQKLGSVPGFDAVIDSSVPLGGGVSSSAALEVASATLLEAILGKTLDPEAKALLCQKAEHEYAGVPCGIMDQFTSVFAEEGHALLLDCRSRKFKLVPMNDPDVTVLVINTNVRHKLADGEYAKRRAQCEKAAKAIGVPALRDATLASLKKAQKKMDPVAFRRARHVITENERTEKAAEELSTRKWASMGKLMYESHASLRDDYEVSCKELDIVVDAARTIGAKGGVYGCRMTGGGFGGCAVGLVKTEAAHDITRQIGRIYEDETKISATIFSCRPSGGAKLLK
jgi:galactokinase